VIDIEYVLRGNAVGCNESREHTHSNLITPCEKRVARRLGYSQGDFLSEQRE
jgi:hypothetical protein